VAAREVLTELSLRLGAAEEHLGAGARRTRVAARRARVRIEGLLGEPPVVESPAGEGPLAHLEAADALAREHLGEAGLEGQIRRAVGDALLAAREEL
jgi:hypothetical protein